MSKLTEMLNQIALWVEQYNKEEFNLFVNMRPGLTFEEIQIKVEKLPFRLTREIIELYQWRNGGYKSFLPFPDGGYDLQEFLSLEDAISGIENWDNNIFRKMNAFPLFGIEGAVYWTVGFQEEKDFAPIYSNDEAEFPVNPNYPSLFAMVEENLERLQRFDK